MAGCSAATAATMSGLVTSFSSLSVSKPQQSSSCCSSSLTLRSSFIAKATTQHRQQLSEIETLALDIRSVRKGSRNGSRGVVRMGPLEAGVGLMGTKMGMMTVFTADGIAIPCTVVGFHEGNIVTQVKSEATDGYTAVQVGYRRVRDRKLTKPERGHLEKVGAIPMRHLQEFRVLNTEGYEPNQRLVLEDIFKDGDLIDVVGNSIGKGFAGGIKRWNFARGPMSHGSKSHRQLGSIGAGTTPGRVYPGKKMPGRLGGGRTKIRKLEIVKVDKEIRALLIKGAVPGKPGNLLRITPAKIVGKNIP
jgi:large subunit ribosomal protein L3